MPDNSSNVVHGGQQNMTNKIPEKLNKLYKKFDGCKRCKQQKNKLRHILGGGKFARPKLLFLFINPTHLNLSSHQDYKGKRRFPFIGVRYFWKLMSQAGFISNKLIERIYKTGWLTEYENGIERELIDNDIYITNLVKCTQSNPDNPNKDIISQDLGYLIQEIDLVNPKFVITFGKLPTEVLTNKTIKLADYYDDVKRSRYKPIKSPNNFSVLPCYFPIGRGNPLKAIEILRYIKKNY